VDPIPLDADSGTKFRQMGISKPYYRIIRPFFSNGSASDYNLRWEEEYPADRRYADDRQELWRAYMLIEKDLLRLFEYVEASDNNIKTYSHRTYELLLRAATEFETNCKRILESNRYSKSKDLNITDYFKINQSSKLEEYSISLTVWSPQKKMMTPFKTWASGKASLPWYKSYNRVKHDRNKQFEDASLENVLHAVAAVYVILFSQFVFFSGTPSSWHDHYVSDDETTISTSGGIFEVMPPKWSDEEIYKFDWDEIKDYPEPFTRFPFA
jgi:hypothetical protein